MLKHTLRICGIVLVSLVIAMTLSVAAQFLGVTLPFAVAE